MIIATPRPVYCLLGLPFDALSLAGAEGVIRSAVTNLETGILSTPNLNWIALARKDPVFRQSVLVSDCIVADGMPLIWLARLLGLPFPERVSGADLIERLRRGGPPVRVFFFGGLGDVADRAVKALQQSPQGLIAVGSLNPGKGAVESMSTPTIIATINACRPDIVIVSLGAEKGQAWIIRNRAALDAAWVTHLGAVVNFFAGEVSRAPSLVGKLGLEWIWRILQEPKLARRYWGDGKLVLGLLLTRILPLLLRRALAARVVSLPPEIGDVSGRAGTDLKIKIRGDFGAEHSVLLSPFVCRAVQSRSSLSVDCTELTHCDAATLGQLMLARGQLHEAGQSLTLLNVPPPIQQIFNGHCAEFLLPLVREKVI